MLVSEYGGAAARIEHYLHKGVEGARNVMRHLGILPGEVAATEGQRVVETLINVAPNYGGILLSNFPPDRLGETLPEGTVLGRVINPHTFEEHEEITTPFQENILILTRPSYTNVAPGDYAFMIADAATASPA